MTLCVDCPHTGGSFAAPCDSTDLGIHLATRIFTVSCGHKGTDEHSSQSVRGYPRIGEAITAEHKEDETGRFGPMAGIASFGGAPAQLRK